VLAVRQFRFGCDNLGYLLYGEKTALAIDGGATEEILAFLHARGLILRLVANTHSHPDHTGGNRTLLRETGARLLSFRELAATPSFTIDGEDVDVILTPGHSEDSVCFLAGGALISGDTLFNGTVGNCCTGNWQAFFASLVRLTQLPPETRVYAGHDYVRDAIAFAKLLEPYNATLDRYLERYNPDCVFSTLGEELIVNPFLRWDDEALAAILAQRGLPHATAFARWHSLMTMD